jgi:hypothetical protein
VRKSICLALFLALVLAAFTRAEDSKTPYQTGTPRRIVAADNQKKRMAIIAADGKVEWERQINDCHDLHVLPN